MSGIASTLIFVSEGDDEGDAEVEFDMFRGIAARPAGDMSGGIAGGMSAILRYRQNKRQQRNNLKHRQLQQYLNLQMQDYKG